MSAAWKKLTKLLNRPISIAFITVFITALAGYFYDRLIQNRALESERRAEAINSGHELLKAASERRVLGNLVISGIRRRIDLEHLYARKVRYDESFVNWNKALISQISVLRLHFDSSDENEIEQLLNQHYLPWFYLADSCLTRAYDAQIASEPADPPALEIIEECGSPNIDHHRASTYSYLDIKRTLHGCEIAVVLGVINPLRNGATVNDSDWASIVEESAEAFERHCQPDWGE